MERRSTHDVAQIKSRIMGRRPFVAIQDGNCPGEGVSDPFVSIRDQATKTHDCDVGFYAQFSRISLLSQ